MATCTEAHNGYAMGIAHPLLCMLSDLDDGITCLNEGVQRGSILLYRIIQYEDIVAHREKVKGHGVTFPFRKKTIATSRADYHRRPDIPYPPILGKIL